MLSVSYFSICTIKSDFLSNDFFNLHVLEHLFHYVSPKKCGRDGERLIGKNNKTKEKVLQERKLTSYMYSLSERERETFFSLK